MKYLLLTLTAFAFLFTACNTGKHATDKGSKSYVVLEDSLVLYDTVRSRNIPLELYYPKTNQAIKHQKLVLISHGYNVNRPGSNKNYSFIANHLASEGYYVASIQHELPNDSLIPDTGIPQIVRRPHWERGVTNILFVLNAFKKTNPQLDYDHVVLVGHSNGGDMSMLFAQKYPKLIDVVISLDNRRMAFPRTNHPHIYSLRSSDQPADEGVLPTKEEQDKYSMKIIKLQNTIHNDMDDNATETQRKEMLNDIDLFLNDAYQN